MPDLSTQAAFAAALLAPEVPVPPDIAVPSGVDPARRFAVYRNNVVTGLVDALAEAFPVTRSLVGEDFFRAMARHHALAHPPDAPELHRYGRVFPDFIAGFPPAAGLPYLADVARLERLRLDAWHAEAAPTLAPAPLWAALTAPEGLAALPLRPHPATRWLRSAYPVVSIWRAHQEPSGPSGVALRHAEDALLVRADDAIEIHPLPAGGIPLLDALQAGCPLGRAAAQACTETTALAPLLALLLARGALAALPPEGCSE